MVRCSTQFLQTVMVPMGRADRKAPYGHASDVLRDILANFIPCTQEIFAQSLVSPLCVLELNDWEMEKSLLWYIIAIEKWMSGDWRGIHAWPPTAPAAVTQPELLRRE